MCIRLTTHELGGLTQRDVHLARLCDKQRDIIIFGRQDEKGGGVTEAVMGRASSE